MTRTRIKICGITSLEEALLAARAGADAIGMVLYAPGAGRLVDADVARKISMALPPFVTAVGVVVDCPSNRVRQLLAHIPLSAVQFGGRESPQDVRSTQPTPAIKKLNVSGELPALARTWGQAIIPNLSAVLVEPAADYARQIETAMAELRGDSLPPLVLGAGKLEGSGLGDLVRKLRPWAVDLGMPLDAEGNLAASRIDDLIATVRSAGA